MKPSIGSDADPLRRPLLNTSSSVDEERLGHLSPPCRTSEKQKQTYNDANSGSEHETDSILTLEGVSSWVPPQHYPRLERQRARSAEKLHAVQLSSSTAETEQRADISAHRGMSAAVEKKQAHPHSAIRKTTATRSQRPRSNCEASPLPYNYTASPTELFPRDEQQKTVHVFETAGVGTLEELPLNQTQCPAPMQTPPFLIIRAGDALPAHSELRHSILTRLCFTCLSRAQRAGWRLLRACRDCNTAFWWLLSPLFLLFTWFCWHGVHALWKVSSRGPGHWLSAGEESVVHDYGLVIDAGSHGSRLSIYSWKPRLFDPIHPFTGPVSFPKLCFRGTPQGALTSPLQVPSILSALIDQGTEFFHFRARVPELRWSDFPLYLKATGGMRNMEQAPRDILMETVRDYLESRQFNPFRFERAWARVLAGEEEGVYGWLAVNNGRNSLIDDPARTTGALDLGGASAQITFFPTHTSVLEDLTLIRLGDRTIRLYSHSYLGYGWGDALSRVSTDLAVEALLRRIKANPRFITENTRAARPLAVSPNGRSIWEETLPPLDTFNVFASAVQRFSTTQKANSEIPRICPPTKDTHGSLASLGAREVRRLSVEVDNEEEVDIPRSTKKIRNGSVNGQSSNALSTELEKKAKAIDTKTAGGKSRHFVGRKRRKKGKERVGVSGQQKRKGKAVERSGETKEGGILSLRRQPETSLEGQRNTHIPVFTSSDDEVMTGSQDADISPHEIQESEPHDIRGFLREQQEVLKEVGAKETESDFSQEDSKTQITSPAAAARLFLLKGEKKRRDKPTNRPSTEGLKPLWKKQELQYGRTAFPWTRRRTAAPAASPPRDNEINEVESERHQPGFSKMNKEQLPVSVSTEEGTITKIPHENEDTVGTIPQGREKEIDKEGLSGLMESAEETMISRGTEKPLGEAGFAYELVFTVEHPCFPRGTVYDFPLPLLSYPERRYFADISVNNIEAYMRAAGYAEHDIKKILKTMYPHAVDNHQAMQGPVSDNLHPQQHWEKAAAGGSNFFPPEVNFAKQSFPSHQSHFKQVNSERKQLVRRAGMRVPQQQELVDPLFDKTQYFIRREESKRHIYISQATTSGNNQSSSSEKEKSSFPESDPQGKDDAQIETNVKGTNFASFPLAAASPAAPVAALCAAASVYDGKKTSERESRNATGVAADIQREDGSSATAAAGITTLPQKTVPAAHAMRMQLLKDETPGGEGQQGREKTKERAKEHSLRDQEKTASREEDFTATMKPEIHFIARFVGSGDFDACHARAKKLFHKSLCFMNSCSFNGVYQPRLDNSNFLAFGQYSKVHAAMGLPQNAPLSAFFEGAKHICRQRVRQLQLKRRLQGFSALVYSKKSVEKLCWKAIWSYAMLRQGFGFATSSTRISFAPVPGDSAAGPAPEWATGSMIAEVNSYPWEVPPETYEGPFHLATAFLIMSVILALILYREMHWMRRRLRESQRREPTENGNVVVSRGRTGDGVAPAGKLRGQESLDG